MDFTPLHNFTGFCLEKLAVPVTSKFKAAEREEKIIDCYERAGDLAILFFQEQDKTVPSMASSTSLTMVETRAGPLLERAIQQSPLMHIKNGLG